MLSNTEAELKKGVAYNSLKKCIEVHFNRSKIFLLYFNDCEKKKVPQKYGLFIRANVFIEFHHLMKKKIDPAED